MLITEESRTSVIIFLSFVLLLVTGVYEQYVLWISAGIIAIIVIVSIYAMLWKKKYGEPQDERSARCSLAASRNGFIVVMVLSALLAAGVKLGAPYDVIDMVRMVWGLGVAAYFLSYLYYKRFV
jgi:hypothetical protein